MALCIIDYLIPKQKGVAVKGSSKNTSKYFGKTFNEILLKLIKIAFFPKRHTLKNTNY